MKKMKYSKSQIKALSTAIKNAAKRCRQNDDIGSRVRVWEDIINTDGWPQAARSSHKERAQTLFQEPTTGLERRVVLLIDSGRIGIPTLGPHGKDNEYAPFTGQAIAKSLENTTDSGRQALTGEKVDTRDMLQHYIDALDALL